MKTQKMREMADARTIAEGCEKEALIQGWAVSFAIVDQGGHLIWLQRMDGANLTTMDFALGKARTAAIGRRPSKHYEDAMAQKLTMMTLPGKLTRVEGGLPIVVDGDVVGAVGVSGVKSPEDSQIARAGIAALLETL